MSDNNKDIVSNKNEPVDNKILIFSAELQGDRISITLGGKVNPQMIVFAEKMLDIKIGEFLEQINKPRVQLPTPFLTNLKNNSIFKRMRN